jgi:hypothetical protein|tara:strand:+ start:2625 stop:3041 length:417 start_codon:yes stop_codon:yes gene_type:complete
VKLNKKNWDKVKELVVKNLTPDLIPRKWMIEKNKTNPMFGHCHHASAVMQKIFGKDNVQLFYGECQKGKYTGQFGHWWNKVDDEIQDLTEDQYYSVGETPPYEFGEEKGPITQFGHGKSFRKLYKKVINEFKKYDNNA